MNTKIASATVADVIAAQYISQSVFGTFVESTGDFFLLTARATIKRGDVVIASLASPSATLVRVTSSPGTALTVVCGTSAEIWSSRAITQSESDSQAVASVPEWLNGAMIGFERQNVFPDPRVPIFFHYDDQIQFGIPIS